MEKTEALLSPLLDMMDEGVLVLDHNHHIIHMNKKAKKITGILLNPHYSHNAGTIETGDIVIFISNQLGADDGPLAPSDLECLGFNPKAIAEGESIMGIGIYQNQSIAPIYKHIKESSFTEKLELRDHFLGHDIECSLDYNEKRMVITVNQMVFEQTYTQSFGHMVIINGETSQIKFFQDKGYTIRHEAIGDLLKGRPFDAKSKHATDWDSRLINQPFESFFTAKAVTEALTEIDQMNETRQIKKFISLNHRPIYTIISPLDENYVLKFRDLSEMDSLLKEHEQLLDDLEQLHPPHFSKDELLALNAFESIIGHSYAMRQVKFLAAKAANVTSSILLTGESGTGKSLLAEHIHKESQRQGRFVAVNCAAIPESLFESELFGYEKGAFTGANQQGKIGYFEQADQGTLFLDEIGELPLNIQAKLLQALQTKSFFRVGAHQPSAFNVRVITATNIDLLDAVKQGYFRSDLYYRINVFPIHIPALRERKEDLYALVKNSLNRICTDLNMPLKQISGEAFQLIKRYQWPGNIRELENVLERAVVITPYDVITPEVIHYPTSNGQPQSILPLKEQLEQAEKEILKAALRDTTHKKEAIEKLGLSKSSFYDKLKKYQLD